MEILSYLPQTVTDEISVNTSKMIELWKAKAPIVEPYIICWESYMPLARVALYQKGITIYISPNTNDNPEWQASIQHIAIEGKCYFINADMIIRKGSYPDDLNEKNAVAALPDMVCRGGSCIIDPYGHYVTDPVWDEETIIYAELDMDLPAACKMEHDAVGHYARPDVLQLIITDR